MLKGDNKMTRAMYQLAEQRVDEIISNSKNDNEVIETVASQIGEIGLDILIEKGYSTTVR